MFKIAREEWLSDKKTLEDTIVDMTTSENFAEDSLTRESDAQAHQAHPDERTFFLSKFLRSTYALGSNRLPRRDTHVRSLCTQKLLSPWGISSGISMIFGFLVDTTGLLPQLIYPLLRAVGASRQTLDRDCGSRYEV